MELLFIFQLNKKYKWSNPFPVINRLDDLDSFSCRKQLKILDKKLKTSFPSPTSYNIARSTKSFAIRYGVNKK